MFSIDTSTPFGARVDGRLREDLIVWLTTVGAGGTPHPVPVWFFWDGESALIYSKPDTPKLRHIAANPRVSLNFDGDRWGNNIVVLTGRASLAEGAPPAHLHSEYTEKYREGMGSIGMTPEEFAAAYNVALRITPEKLTGH